MRKEMGKIVKYCSACDADWAEKFGFCPTCGSTLQAFELKPIEKSADPVPTEVRARVTGPLEMPEPEPPPFIAEPAFEAAPEVAAVEAEPEPIVESLPAVKPEPQVPAAPVFVSKAMDADPKPPVTEGYVDDGLFHVTVIEEKDVAKRNWLLLGATFLVTATLLTGIVANLFSQSLDIDAINDEISRASLIDLDPMTVEEEQQKKEKDDAGGGGGGGREEKTPASRGDLADQTQNPIRPPDAKVPRLDDPALVLPPPSTKGNKKFDKQYGVWGDPNSQYTTLSNGDGSGGGIGSGRGTGQGSGNGTGAGNGNGSGFGNGDGDGNGNGRGDGDEGLGAPPASGPSSGVKVTFKPKPNYTDAARQNQVQGKVMLRVTFLASGGIGSISTVKGLPYGLTEQAIAAARSIRFTPAMVNGIRKDVTKNIEYTFAIY
ncbi:MAG: energy transducer TonB [Acidobacteria bacterium]|nr:energy transducer TonB [Acidobacteriota bacterium]